MTEDAVDSGTVRALFASIVRRVQAKYADIAALNEAATRSSSSVELHDERFRALWDAGRCSDAMLALQRAVELDAGSLDRRLRTADFFMAVGDPGMALVHVEAATRIAPGSFDVWSKRARLELRLRAHEDVLRSLAVMRRLEPPDGRSWVHMAELAMLAGDFEHARADLRKARTAEDGLALARAEAGRLRLWAGNLHSASVLAERAARDDDSCARAHSVLGAVAAMRGRLLPALDELNRALDLNPADSETLVWRGEVLLDLGRPEDAAGDFQRAEQLGGYSLAAHLAQRRKFDDINAPGMVAELVEIAAGLSRRDIDGSSATMQALRAILDDAHLALRGNRSHSATHVRPGTRGPRLQRYPHEPYLRAVGHALKALVRTRGLEGAAREMDALCERHPESPRVHTHMGELWLFAGDADRAEAAFLRALDLGVTGVWAYVGLCGVGLLRADYDTAHEWCARGARASEAALRTMFVYRGELYRRSGKLDLALEDLTRDQSLTPTRVGGWLNLALIRIATGDEALGRREFLRIAERVPYLVVDAVEELGSPIDPARAEDRAAVLEACLTMMRGNRSSYLLTYFSKHGMRVATISGGPDRSPGR